MRHLMTNLATVWAAFAFVAPALAADTTKVYTSGILVVAFVAVLALVIVAQLLPAVMLLVGMVKGLVTALFRRHATAPGRE